MSDAAITVLVSGAVQIVITVVGLVTLWIKVKYGVDKAESIEKKTDDASVKITHVARKTDSVASMVDANTQITREGTAAAVVNAQTAAETAASAKSAAAEARTAVENINRKLNGGLDHSIAQAVEPLKEVIESHARNFVTKEKFEELIQYVRKRNHDVLDAQQTLNNKIELIIARLDGKDKIPE